MLRRSRKFPTSKDGSFNNLAVESAAESSKRLFSRLLGGRQKVPYKGLSELGFPDTRFN